MRMSLLSRWVFALTIALAIPTLATAQVSSTEQAVMDKILKLKSEIDALMMKPGTSSDKAAMDKVLDMKKDIDTFMALLPPELQKQVQDKMAQSSNQTARGNHSVDAEQFQDLPFVMTPQDVKKVEVALMRSQLVILKRIATALRQKGTLDANLQNQWAQFVEGVAGSGMGADVPSLTKYVMREAYAKQHEDLELLGNKVRYYRDMRDMLKEEIEKIKKLTDTVSDAGDPLPQSIRKKRFSLGLDGSLKQQVGNEIADKADALQYIEELKQHLTTTNEGAEAATLELEGALLRQQSKLKTMSDISQKLEQSGKAAVLGEQ